MTNLDVGELIHPHVKGAIEDVFKPEVEDVPTFNRREFVERAIWLGGYFIARKLLGNPSQKQTEAPLQHPQGVDPFVKPAVDAPNIIQPQIKPEYLFGRPDVLSLQVLEYHEKGKLTIYNQKDLDTLEEAAVNEGWVETDFYKYYGGDRSYTQFAANSIGLLLHLAELGYGPNVKSIVRGGHVEKSDHYSGLGIDYDLDYLIFEYLYKSVHEDNPFAINRIITLSPPAGMSNVYKSKDHEYTDKSMLSKHESHMHVGVFKI